MELNLLHVGDTKIGYGRMGVKLNAALEDLGVTCYRHLGEAFLEDGTRVMPQEVGQMKHLVDGQPEAICNVICWMSVPSHARGWWNGQVPVIFTMWESTYLPESFRESLDEFETVIVPSMQNVELFSRYHSNVRYVPLGIDPAEWYYRERKEPGQFFNFLIGGSGARKGTDLAVRAFKAVFPDGSWGDGPIPQLIMKNPRGEPDLEGERIVQITGHLDREEEIELYADAHCYLQPSRGEGFGLQPLQAIAQGCPTILTNAHGHESFAHLGYGLDTTLTQSAYFIYGDAGDWWEPDFDQLCDYMRYVYNDYEEVCKKAHGDAVAAAFTFTWENTAQSFLDVIGRERLEVPYSGDGTWYWAKARLYPTMTLRNHKCEIAGVHRIFEAGVEYWEPADVKRILYEYGILDPRCCKTDGTEDVGLLPQQVERLGKYEAKHSFCPTCNQQLNTQPNAFDLEMARREGPKLQLVMP